MKSKTNTEVFAALMIEALRRARAPIPKITDIDYMQAVGMNAALGSFMKGFKALLRPGAREIVASNQGQGGAPMKRFGLSSPPSYNRAEPDDDDNDGNA